MSSAVLTSPPSVAARLAVDTNVASFIIKWRPEFAPQYVNLIRGAELVVSCMTLAEMHQSVSLPPKLAKQVHSMAKSRKLSVNRMLVELIENGIDAEKRKQEQFFALAERFRNEKDPEAANRLGDELGRMVFGG